MRLYGLYDLSLVAQIRDKVRYLVRVDGKLSAAARVKLNAQVAG